MRSSSRRRWRSAGVRLVSGVGLRKGGVDRTVEVTDGDRLRYSRRFRHAVVMTWASTRPALLLCVLLLTLFGRDWRHYRLSDPGRLPCSRREPRWISETRNLYFPFGRFLVSAAMIRPFPMTSRGFSVTTP